MKKIHKSRLVLHLMRSVTFCGSVPSSMKTLKILVISGVVLVTAYALAHAASISSTFHHHAWLPGESLNYIYEDSDTTYSATSLDGTVQAGDVLQVQEIHIPVTIDFAMADGSVNRKLTISVDAEYRESAQNQLPLTTFALLTKLIKGYVNPFTYNYSDETQAMNKLQNIFKSLRADPIGEFLFFKMQDVHQMLESTEKIPDGILPGKTHLSPKEDRPGLGGQFTAAPGQLIYEGTEAVGGERSALFKVASLGNIFSMPGLKTYTNYTFTMHVGLEGSHLGLLLHGEGNETATVLQPQKNGQLAAIAVLQRQFTITLQ